MRKKDNLYVKHLSSDVSFVNKFSYIDYRKTVKNHNIVISTKISKPHHPDVNDEELKIFGNNITFMFVKFIKI